MMSSDLFQRELAYQASIVIALTMVANGLISEVEYADFNSRLLSKYEPPIGGLISNSYQPAHS